MGEMVIKSKAANIFFVAGFRGNSNLSYLCLQADGVEFYHCGEYAINIICIIFNDCHILVE